MSAARRPGKPGPTPARFRHRDVRRFLSKCASGPSGCVLWTAATRDGYGRFSLNGRDERAHRIAWLFMRGPIPPGLVIDHKCRVRACQNVEHLRPVTAAENTRCAPLYNQPTCKHGHAWTEENTRRRRDGRRACKECQRRRDRERAARRRAARSDAKTPPTA